MPPNASIAAWAIASADSSEATSTHSADRREALGLQLERRLVLPRSRVEVGDDDRCSRLGQRLGVDDADATCAAGDDGDLAGQVEELVGCHALTEPRSCMLSQVA